MASTMLRRMSLLVFVLFTVGLFGARPPQIAHAQSSLPLLYVNPETGTIYDSTNREVNLFGVNYFGGQQQYVNIFGTYDSDFFLAPTTRTMWANLGVTNVKTQVIDRDLDDLQRMGVNLIRLHIMMGDIANADGSLRIGSAELDWFDYLVAGAIQRGMYFYLTPIVAWDWYVSLPGRFSSLTWGDDTYTADLTAINRSGDFIYNLMMHTNPYLGRAYAAEPGIGLIEILNEPAYRYDPSQNYNTAPFSYNFIKDTLINGQIQRVRDAEAATPGGVTHLVGWSIHGYNRTKPQRTSAPSQHAGPNDLNYVTPCPFNSLWEGANPNVATAIRDSNAQFYALDGYTWNWWCGYPYYGGPNGGPVSEAFVPADVISSVPAALDTPKRGRVVYEWDAPSVQKFYIYPNIAAAMRNRGHQAVAMFQYDAFVDAHRNSFWANHYLSYHYTPERAVSFMIARETFQNAARGAAYSDNATGTATLAGYTKTSFPSNISTYFDGRTLMHTRSIPSGLAPNVTTALRYVTGVGNSSVATYTGSGIYRLWRTLTPNANYLTLEVNPDVTVQNRSYTVNGQSYSSSIYFDPRCYCSFNDPNQLSDTRTLVQRNRSFSLNWPGISGVTVYRVEANGSETLIGTYASGASFTVQTGVVGSGAPRNAQSIYYKLYPTGSTPTNANQVVNGDFATGSLSGWYQWWNTTYSNAIAQQNGGNSYMTHWNQGAYQQYSSQMITDLPNGTYTLNVQAIASAGMNHLMIGVKNHGSAEQTFFLPTNGITNWTTYTLPGVTVTNNQAEVYVYTDAQSGGRWAAFDEIRFTRNP